MNDDKTQLDHACEYLGWQGGTIHDAWRWLDLRRDVLKAKVDRLQRLAAEKDQDVGLVVRELSKVETLLRGLES